MITHEDNKILFIAVPKKISQIYFFIILISITYYLYAIELPRIIIYILHNTGARPKNIFVIISLIIMFPSVFPWFFSMINRSRVLFYDSYIEIEPRIGHKFTIKYIDIKAIEFSNKLIIEKIRSNIIDKTFFSYLSGIILMKKYCDVDFYSVVDLLKNNAAKYQIK